MLYSTALILGIDVTAAYFNAVLSLALRVAEHPVGAFVRASVAAILAGKSSVRANRLDHALPAVRPLVALDQPHAVGADLLLCNVIAVPGGTTGTVVRRILVWYCCVTRSTLGVIAAGTGARRMLPSESRVHLPHSSMLCTSDSSLYRTDYSIR